ncbi:MAG: hypothetical protein ABI167_01360 [Nitrosospira sp.]
MVSLCKIFLLVFPWVIFLLSFDAFAQMEAVPFVQERLTMLPSGKRVTVTFRERLCKTGECREVDEGMWGMDGGVPQFVSEIFLVYIDGNKFVIPEKLYKDFTNTYHLKVFEQTGRES